MSDQPVPAPPGVDAATIAQARSRRDELGRALVDAVVAALPAWVEHRVEARLPVGAAGGDRRAALVVEAAEAALAEGRPRLEAAVLREPGIHHGPTPLEELRSLTRFPAGVLEELGAEEVPRGEFETRAFPDDVYDLSPATWSDLGPDVQQPGLAWGAATAHLHKLRRRAAGA